MGKVESSTLDETLLVSCVEALRRHVVVGIVDADECNGRGRESRKN